MNDMNRRSFLSWMSAGVASLLTAFGFKPGAGAAEADEYAGITRIEPESPIVAVDECPGAACGLTGITMGKDYHVARFANGDETHFPAQITFDAVDRAFREPVIRMVFRSGDSIIYTPLIWGASQEAFGRSLIGQARPLARNLGCGWKKVIMNRLNRRSFIGWLSAGVASLFGLRAASPATPATRHVYHGYNAKITFSGKRRLRIYESGADWSFEKAKAVCLSLVPAGTEFVGHSLLNHFDRNTICFKVRHPSFDDCSNSLTIPVFQMTDEQPCAYPEIYGSVRHLERPNPRQDWEAFTREALRQIDLTGSGIFWNVKNAAGAVVERCILPTAECSLDKCGDTILFCWVYRHGGTVFKGVANRVVHIAGDQIDVVYRRPGAPPGCDLDYIDVNTPRPAGYWPQVWCDGQRLKTCVSAMPKAGLALLASDEGIGRLIENVSSARGATWLIGGEIRVKWVKLGYDYWTETEPRRERNPGVGSRHCS